MRKIFEEFGGSVVYLLLGLGCCSIFWGILAVVSAR